MSDVETANPRRHWFHIPIQITVAASCIYWYWHAPAPNKAVLWLGGVAAIMALVEMRPVHKALYFLLIICLMFIENRAIDKERADAVKLEDDRRTADNKNFQSIANGIQTAITDSQTQFNATMRRSNSILKSSERALESSQEGLRTNQENFAYSTGGDTFCYLDPFVVGGSGGKSDIWCFNTP